MQTYVSYVLQDATGHKHLSEIITTQNPTYTFSADPQVSDVIDWTKKKKSELKEGQELVVLTFYKL